MTYKKWDIILVPFPFTDQSNVKKRPALIISPNSFNMNGPDIVIAFITSNIESMSRTGDYIIKFWKQADLPKPSLLRMKFTSIDKKNILKRIGALVSEDILNYQRELIKILCLVPL
ncbi:MAG: type II toxin-antitoxin system PemK/MazF family toxin [Candidatus Marinimicrobia bacterium]|nr:type II toxin-antitoxin system PemK/MazF family toxin [Candidatus Neomarinimicrobiota bacterium]